MKKLFSLLLVLLLALSAAIPAAAAESGSQAELEQVTRSVKETLDLDTESYTDFRGNYTAGELAPVWNLYWSGDAGSLSVSALDDGTVVSYTLNLTEAVSSSGTGLPAFPQGDPEQARTSAETFLKRVLGAGESAALEESSGLDRLNSTTYRFSGTVLLNGLPSPLTCSVTVRASDNLVTRFRRDVPESTFLGSIPSASASAAKSAAAQALRTTQSLRLEYILPDADSTAAVLCYLPNSGHTFYVDAKTGKLVDLTALEELMYRSAMGGAVSNTTEAESGTASDTEKNLSQAEQTGIQQLEGVRSEEELDKALRAVGEYGLSSYALTSVRFSVGEAEETGGEAPVTCVLQYSRAEGEDVLTRIFTVDARTGQVQRLSSYIPWDQEKQASLTREEALDKARAFLKTYYPDHYAHLALYEIFGDAEAPSDSARSVSSYSFCFARKENGYFFPEQDYTVRIDAADGSVCGLTYRYDETVTFADPQGVISAEAAMDAWMDTYDVTLGYLLVPRELSGTDAVTQRLRQMGLEAYYYLELGYTLECGETCRGIDAKSGKPLAGSQQSPETGLLYSDAASSWAGSEIQRLARYGVGYDGGVFQPEKALTQWDLVCLLYSLRNVALDPSQATEQQRNEAYAAAYEMGVLTRAERWDSALLTRSQLVHCLLDSAGYGSVAKLKGIFTCAYPDKASISADELGYAALAQGLGLVRGAYNGAGGATRAQAAAMLCRLMDR